MIKFDLIKLSGQIIPPKCGSGQRLVTALYKFVGNYYAGISLEDPMFVRTSGPLIKLVHWKLK